MNRHLSYLLKILFVSTAIALLGSGCKYEDNSDNLKGENIEQQNIEQLSSANVYPENGLPKYKKVTLKVGFFISGYGREWYDICAKKFSDKFPNVSFETEYSEKIYDIAKERIAAGNDDIMFDLWYGDWRQLAENGKLEPMDDLLERSLYDTPDLKLKDVVTHGMFDNIERYDGSIYVLPHNIYIGGLFYDKKFFAENKWNENPVTWNEFLRLCQDIKKEGITPLAFPGKYPYYLDYSFIIKVFDYADSTGDKEFTKNWRERKEPQFTSPQMTKVWNRIYDMGKQGYFFNNLAEIDHIEAQNLVLQHKVAMVSTCDWVGNEMKKSVPEGFEWGYMAVPFGDNSNQTIYIKNGFNNDFVVWKAKPDLNKKWAKEFMLWLMNVDCQKVLAEKGGALPLRKDCINIETEGNLQSSQKSVLNYMKDHKVKLESMARNAVITGYNTRTANELIDSAYVSICLGKSDGIADLETAEKIIQKEMILKR